MRPPRHVRALAAPLAIALAAACGSDADPAPPPTGPPTNGSLRAEAIVAGLDTPWDLAWGPDGRIWVSERGGRISRVDPETGARTTAGTVPQVLESGESGLLGIAHHPDFAGGQPFVYAMHSYASGGGIRNRLVRMRWDGSALGAPEVLLANIPGATIHDGARIAVRDRLLYITTGDASNTSLARDRASLAGKVLRLDLDGRPAAGNPFGTAVWSYGHRNPQGLAFHPATGALYASEHGPGDNDEINRIEAGRDYGWPDVRGRCDGDVSGEQAVCQADDIAEPLAIWTPTLAVSGADVYASDRIPAWTGSLLVTSLKAGTLLRLALSADGRAITSQELLYAGQFGRLRDVLVSPAGEVFLATSNRDGRGSPTGEDDRIVRIRP